MLTLKKPGSVLQMTMTLVALSALGALSACGGGSDGGSYGPQPPVSGPEAPTTPTTPTTPTPPTTPTTPPTTPSDPSPPDSFTVTLATTPTNLGASIGTSVQNWPAWTGTGQPVDGVGCARNENYHIHTLLTIYRDRARLAIPDMIGRSGCTYELHTHDTSGIIHIETDVPKKFMLSQYFSLWRQPFTSTNVAGLSGPFRYYLIENGQLTRYTGDPMAIELRAYREIVILTGTNPPPVLPKYTWTPGL
jgi:hypothetical protein